MNIEQLSVAAIRATCIDGINKAKSGHPGMALGSAPIIYALFSRHLVSNPAFPNWINRDRFVLSAGHASMLLYTQLHIAGYDVKIDDLKRFRQIDSLTPGHPEYRHTPGVDATSGPLGQGIAQAVGMAMAETMLQGIYPDGERLFNHYTYCLCGDGCLQEGLSQEAISLAGHQKLRKLILFYDSNAITLDGSLDLTFSENVKERFKASQWNVLEVEDGNDIDAIDKAIKKAKKSKDAPTLIIIHTIIGFGSKNQGKCNVHGSPLGDEDGRNAKLAYGYNHDAFEIPQAVYDHFQETFVTRGDKAIRSWNREFNSYRKAHAAEAQKLLDTIENNVDKFIYRDLPDFPEGFKDATRNTSQAILNILHPAVFNLVGGSADVAKSVMTSIKDEPFYSPLHRGGRTINFGIREFAMASAQNGMLLHGGLRTYVGCFLIFADYMKAAIRMSALSKLPAIYVLSHDSIAVGEDGPTHQPIEQLAMLRSIPNVDVYRPCDARETASAWKLALLSQMTPSCLALSRQNLPLIPGSNYEGVNKGGYIISKERGEAPDITIIATGSEVELAINAQEKLYHDGINVRVISMPCVERFKAQPKGYQEEILGVPYEKRIAVEMLSPFGWHQFAKTVMGIDTFGASAPAGDVIKSYGFTVDNIIDKIKKL